MTKQSQVQHIHLAMLVAPQQRSKLKIANMGPNARLNKLQQFTSELDYEAYLAKVEMINKKKHLLQTFGHDMTIEERQRLIQEIEKRHAKLASIEHALFAS